MTPLPLMGALGDMLGLGNMGIPLASNPLTRTLTLALTLALAVTLTLALPLTPTPTPNSYP